MAVASCMKHVAGNPKLQSNCRRRQPSERFEYTDYYSTCTQTFSDVVLIYNCLLGLRIFPIDQSGVICYMFEKTALDTCILNLLVWQRKKKD